MTYFSEENPENHPKVDTNKYFQASSASQSMGCLLAVVGTHLAYYPMVINRLYADLKVFVLCMCNFKIFLCIYTILRFPCLQQTARNVHQIDIYSQDYETDDMKIKTFIRPET